MKKKIITWLIGLFIIGTPILFIYLSFSNSIDCSQLVIDTYEIHSGINIPKVEFVNCYYDECSRTRISVYELNAQIDLSKFELFERPSQAEYLQGVLLLAEAERPNGSYLYVASGEKWDTKWTYVVDKEAQRLWAELKYDDH